jgi:hypothetical protein
MIYSAYNGAMQTTASPVKVTTAAVIKTMLQIKPLVPCRIIEWGISFDGSAAATPGVCELIQTDVAATVTAYVTNDLTRMDGEARFFGDPTTNYISVGTSASGYTATVEGTTTNVQNLDMPQLIAPTNQFVKQFPLGREPYVEANKFCRIRVNFGAAINALCYVMMAF